MICYFILSWVVETFSVVKETTAVTTVMIETGDHLDLNLKVHTFNIASSEELATQTLLQKSVSRFKRRNGPATFKGYEDKNI